MEPIYTLYLQIYGRYLTPVLGGTPLERAAAIALAEYDREVLKTEPRTFYQFGLAWNRLRNTEPVK